MARRFLRQRVRRVPNFKFTADMPKVPDKMVEFMFQQVNHLPNDKECQHLQSNLQDPELAAMVKTCFAAVENSMKDQDEQAKIRGNMLVEQWEQEKALAELKKLSKKRLKEKKKTKKLAQKQLESVDEQEMLPEEEMEPKIEPVEESEEVPNDAALTSENREEAFIESKKPSKKREKEKKKSSKKRSDSFDVRVEKSLSVKPVEIAKVEEVPILNAESTSKEAIESEQPSKKSLKKKKRAEELAKKQLEAVDEKSVPAEVAKSEEIQPLISSAVSIGENRFKPKTSILTSKKISKVPATNSPAGLPNALPTQFSHLVVGSNGNVSNPQHFTQQLPHHISQPMFQRPIAEIWKGNSSTVRPIGSGPVGNYTAQWSLLSNSDAKDIMSFSNNLKSDDWPDPNLSTTLLSLNAFNTPMPTNVSNVIGSGLNANRLNSSTNWEIPAYSNFGPIQPPNMSANPRHAWNDHNEN